MSPQNSRPSTPKNNNTPDSYGDVFPITVGGKVAAGVTMITGIFCLALPVGIIGSNFTEEWMAYKTKEAKRQALAAPNEVKLLVEKLGTTQVRARGHTDS